MLSGMIYRNGGVGNQNFGPGGITMREIGGKGQREGKEACCTGSCQPPPAIASGRGGVASFVVAATHPPSRVQRKTLLRV